MLNSAMYVNEFSHSGVKVLSNMGIPKSIMMAVNVCLNCPQTVNFNQLHACPVKQTMQYREYNFLYRIRGITDLLNKIKQNSNLIYYNHHIIITCHAHNIFADSFMS